MPMSGPPPKKDFPPYPGSGRRPPQRQRLPLDDRPGPEPSGDWIWLLLMAIIMGAGVIISEQGGPIKTVREFDWEAGK